MGFNGTIVVFNRLIVGFVGLGFKESITPSKFNMGFAR
jgi:hypothetical protein